MSTVRAFAFWGPCFYEGFESGKVRSGADIVGEGVPDFYCCLCERFCAKKCGSVVGLMEIFTVSEVI